MPRTDEELQARDDKNAATAARTFQEIEKIATELARLNSNIEAYLKFNHIGDK